MPNLDVWRPCDAVETLVAWQTALRHRLTPTCLVLSRQSLPAQSRDQATLAAIERGGYVLAGEGANESPDVVVIATGSEVSLAMAARELLAADGVVARVVSLPSWFMFGRQDAAWQESVLPAGVPRVAVEAGVTALWRGIVGLHGGVVGIDCFGESAPASDLAAHFQMTAERVATEALSAIRRHVVAGAGLQGVAHVSAVGV